MAHVLYQAQNPRSEPKASAAFPHDEIVSPNELMCALHQRLSYDLVMQFRWQSMNVRDYHHMTDKLLQHCNYSPQHPNKHSTTANRPDGVTAVDDDLGDLDVPGVLEPPYHSY